MSVRRDGRASLLLAAAVLAAIGIALSWSELRGGGLRRVESWAPEILAAAQESGLDPFLLAGLVYAESRGRPGAVSSAGARGLCQLKDATARETAARLGLAGDPPFAPADNLRLGAAYLAWNVERVGGDVDLGLLGYRLGPGRAAREAEAAGGGAAWLASLRDSGAGPWRYCVQVRDAAERLRARDRDGRTRAWRGAAP